MPRLRMDRAQWRKSSPCALMFTVKPTAKPSGSPCTLMFIGLTCRVLGMGMAVKEAMFAASTCTMCESSAQRTIWNRW